ncbi:MAG TPA: hypothetical protein ENJ95_03415 [Bacteroidetes bacterium]|nr:hypothetical protein [Bacteroidota bacterium]
MFTINIYLRFALMALLLVGGTIMAFFLGFWYSFPFLLAGVILLVGYLLLGTVQSAAIFMQNTDYLGAEKRLNLTLSPKLLYVSNRAYYFIMKGTIAQGLGRSEEAEQWLKQAQALELPTDNEKAAVQLQLAGVAAQKEQWNKVKAYLKNIKKMHVTEQALKDQLKQFERAIKDRGQLKAARRMGMMPKGGMPMKPGGKRRRPKSR